MNYKLLSIAFLATTAASYAAMTTGDRCGQKKIKIDHKTVRIIDGTPLIDMKKISELEEELKKMQFGDNGKGILTYGNKFVTIKELVELEKNHKGRAKLMQEALDGAITHYEKITRSHLREARGFKSQMCALITRWAEQRGIGNSILVDWGNQPEGQELDQLRKLATSFEIFDNLLSDLLCYLRDLRFSCPKSWAKFQKIVGNHGHDEL